MITAIVGGSFGSEGKGAIVGHIGRHHNLHVRVGAANAGHTVYTQEGAEWERHVLQQLPCAAYCAPNAQVVLGAGALISPEILLDEIKANGVWRRGQGLPKLRLFIDWRAHVVQEHHKLREARSDLRERIGSTSAIAKEGIGQAQASRVARTDFVTADEWMATGNWPDGHTSVHLGDSVHLLHSASSEEGILLEGTQGTGLSNITGFYPYVTSRNTSAAGLVADCGIGPRDVDDVIMVVRSYPIRVAGNSGPFYPDSREISWTDIGVDPDTERTTVTKKVRRVATFSYEQVHEAARINSATSIALTFTDHLNAQCKDQIGHMTADETDGLHVIGPTIRRIEAKAGVPVRYLGTGPHSVIERSSDMWGELAA